MKLKKETSELHIEQFDIIDPILRNKLVKKPAVFFILILLIGIIPSILLGLFEGVFINPSLELDMIHDIGFWVLNLLVFPVMGLILILYNNVFSDLLINFNTNGMLLVDPGDYRKFLQKTYNLFHNRILYSIILIFIAAGGLYLSRVFNLNPDYSRNWYRNPERGSISIPNIWQIMIYIPYLYILSRLILNLTLGCFSILRLFKFEIDIQPLHPDRCGGLGLINKISLIMNIFVLFMGIVVAIAINGFQSQFSIGFYHPVNLLMIAAYFVFSTVIVFSPLTAAHRKMKKVRDQSLLSLNNYFKNVNKRLMTNVGNSFVLNEKDVNEIELIQRVYKIINRFPIWPFNFKVIASFAFSLLIPIVTSMVNWLIISFLDGF